MMWLNSNFVLSDASKSFFILEISFSVWILQNVHFGLNGGGSLYVYNV